MDDQGGVAPLDVLTVIKYVNSHGAGWLPEPVSPSDVDGHYVDVNGDNQSSPLDVLELIRYINSRPPGSGGEREATAMSEAAARIPTFPIETGPWSAGEAQPHPARRPSIEPRLFPENGVSGPVPQPRPTPTRLVPPGDGDVSTMWQAMQGEWEELLSVLAQDAGRGTTGDLLPDRLLAELADSGFTRTMGGG